MILNNNNNNNNNDNNDNNNNTNNNNNNNNNNNPPTPWGQSVVDQCFYRCRMAGGGQIAPGTKKTSTAGASSPPLLRMFRAILGC